MASSREARPRSGLDELLETPPEPLQFLAADEATWKKWSAPKSLEVWQAAALHSSVDPDSLGLSAHDVLSYLANLDGAGPEFGIDPEMPECRLYRNIEAASRAIRLGELQRAGAPTAHPETDRVSIGEFHAWALRTKLPMVSGWPSRAGGREPASKRKPPVMQAKLEAASANIAALPATGFLREAQVLEYVPISKATLWRRCSDGGFPRPLKLGPGVVGWSVESLKAWAAQLTDGKPRQSKRC